MSDTDYNQAAQRDARDTLYEFIDTIAEQARDGEVSQDLYNDYPNGDSYHHESHVDAAYSLQEAADLLEQLSEDEETDYGLWSGLAPREAISAQAAYTYGNAVMSRWQSLIGELNVEFLDGIEGEDKRECYARLWVILVACLDADRGVHDTKDHKDMCHSAYWNLKWDDLSGCTVLADWLTEHGQEHRAKEIREALKIAEQEPAEEE